MKKLKRNVVAVVSVIAAGLSMPGLSLADNSIEKVAAPVTQVFSPLGFDSNDSSEVIISGFLPNLCYKAAKADAQVSGKSVQVEVSALKVKGRMCAMMSVPFLEVATLGVLPAGKYSVEVNPGRRRALEGNLTVVKAERSSIDDFIYANVSQIERIEGTRRILLRGENPSSCYDLDEIRLISNGKDVYSVLPILTQVSSRCDSVMEPFEYEFTVPRELPAKKILLHVRVMNGKSVNQLFDNR